MKASEAREIMLKDGFEYIIGVIENAARSGRVSVTVYDTPVEYNEKLKKFGYSIIPDLSSVTISWNKI